MRLYVTPAGRWAGTQAEAKELAREEASGWEQRDVPTDKDGLLSFLNAHAVDAMHGDARAMIEAHANQEPTPAPTSAPAPVTYADRSLAIEDAWDALPLATQLHFAARAVERARTAIKEG